MKPPPKGVAGRNWTSPLCRIWYTHDPAMAANDPSSRSKRWQRRMLRLVLSVVIINLFGLVGVGYPTSFFLRRDDAYETHRRFGWRFLPSHLSRPHLPLHVHADKPPNRTRVLVLGASAVLGHPEPTFSFSRILEVMLQQQFPDGDFEVLNTGTAAINSHVVLDIARDSAVVDPDLMIVLLGNNEVIGPFGPASSVGGFSPNYRMIRASLAIRTTRLGQLAARVGRLFAGSSQPARLAPRCYAGPGHQQGPTTRLGHDRGVRWQPFTSVQAARFTTA